MSELPEEDRYYSEVHDQGLAATEWAYAKGVEVCSEPYASVHGDEWDNMSDGEKQAEAEEGWSVVKQEKPMRNIIRYDLADAAGAVIRASDMEVLQGADDYEFKQLVEAAKQGYIDAALGQ